jgi:hypothetical protein
MKLKAYARNKESRGALDSSKVFANDAKLSVWKKRERDH